MAEQVKAFRLKRHLKAANVEVSLTVFEDHAIELADILLDDGTHEYFSRRINDMRIIAKMTQSFSWEYKI